MSELPSTALEVSPSGDHFLRDGTPHVPLLDTVWNAFAEATPAEWDEYLGFRRAQGFTGLLISLLPILHDRSENPDSRMPYAIDAEGAFDFAAPNEDYFATARAMAERAVEQGFTLFLVVLWSNYVDGAPANGLRAGMTMPSSARVQLADRVVRDFADLDPVLVISGDDPFTTEGPIGVYRELLARFALETPQLLRTFHMWPDAELPAALRDDPALDVMTLQSGHTADDGAKAIELGTREAAATRVLPVLNAEPAYEGHGHVRAEGRFSADEVRRVLWTSLTSGAPAGLGYGAHGVWQWHRAGSTFTQAAFSGMPDPWETALRFSGADDAAFARRLWQDEGLYRARPAQHLLDRDDDGARLSVTPDGRAVLYLPAARDVRVALPLAAVRGWDLGPRTPFTPVVHVETGGIRIATPPVNADLILIGDPS